MTAEVVAWGLLALCTVTVVVIAFEAVRAPARRRSSADGQVSARIPSRAIPYVPVAVGAAAATAVALLVSNLPTWLLPVVGGVVGILTVAVTRWWDEAHETDLVRKYDEART